MPQRTPADFYARFYATSKLNTCWSYAHKIPWWPLHLNVLRIFLCFHPHRAMLWTNFKGTLQGRGKYFTKVSYFWRVVVLIDYKCLDLNEFSSTESFLARTKEKKWFWQGQNITITHLSVCYHLCPHLPSRKNQSVWPVSATEESWGGWIDHNPMRSTGASIWSQLIIAR